MVLIKPTRRVFFAVSREGRLVESSLRLSEVDVSLDKTKLTGVEKPSFDFSSVFKL